MDGKFRRIEVAVRRPGLTIRTRNGYEARKLEGEARPTKPGETPLPLVKALSILLPKPDMPMRVSVAPFAVPGKDTAAVAIVLGLRQPVPRNTRAVETIDLISTAFNNDGGSRAARRQTVQLTLRPVDADDAMYEILSQLELKPGHYDLRFALHSGSLGRSGSVYQEVDIPAFRKDALSLSGVVMSVVPALPAAPKVSRRSGAVRAHHGSAASSAATRSTPHRAQMLIYLKLTNCRVGLLITFNVPVLEDGIRRVANDLRDDQGNLA